MNFRKNTLSLWLLIVTLVSTIAIVGIVPAAVVQPIYVSVDPPAVWDPTMLPAESSEPPTTFTIDITVTYIKKPSAYQFELYYNPDVIHGVSVGNGPFLGSRGGNVVVFPGAGFDNTEGTLSLFGATLFPPTSKNPTGSSDRFGPLATVTFEVVGVGYSPLTLGLDTAMLNITGGVEFPPSSGQYIYGRWNPECLRHGFFSNAPGPELYICRRGAHGGGAWPEWHVGLYTEDQTLYSRIMNYGEMGAWIKVKFVVVSSGYPVMEYWSNEAWIDAATWVSDDIVPGESVVSAEFTPPGPGPAKCYVGAWLYFKAGGMTEYIFYGSENINLDGESVSRDIATTFKVVTKM